MPKALNLHYLLPRALNDAVVALNRVLVATCGSEVDFGAARNHIPHVTLFMGTPLSDAHVETLVEGLTAQVSHVPRLTCRISRPYLKPDRPKWAFFDVLPPEPLIALKRRILDAVSSLIEPPTWNYTAEVPHITVGYLPHSHAEARQHLEEFTQSGPVELDRVQISYMAIRGTCIDPVAEYPVESS
jgi:2'-5' RNA ligase